MILPLRQEADSHSAGILPQCLQPPAYQGRRVKVTSGSILGTAVHNPHDGRVWAACHTLSAQLFCAGAHLLCNINVQGAGGIVVQEEERLGPAGDDVIHAHGNQVDADGVVLVQVKCQLELGADPICASH